jgi:hypothetical protein
MMSTCNCCCCSNRLDLVHNICRKALFAVAVVVVAAAAAFAAFALHVATLIVNLFEAITETADTFEKSELH